MSNCEAPVFFINLAHRTDRRALIEAEFTAHGIRKSTRIDAVFVPACGALGCSLSHIKALETALCASEDDAVTLRDYIVVLEDDFVFKTDPSETNVVLQRLVNIDFDWDVILLAANVGKSVPVAGNRPVVKCLCALTTAGYIVKRHYIPTLLENFKEGARLLNVSRNKAAHAIDVHWLSLQKNHDWYVADPLIGGQRPGYSDIEQCHCDYGGI